MSAKDNEPVQPLRIDDVAALTGSCKNFVDVLTR